MSIDLTAFAQVTEPTYTETMLPSQIVASHFGNTHRDQFRGPGRTVINASLFRSFNVYRESAFACDFKL